MKKRVPTTLFALSLALLAPAIAPAAKPEPERRAKERRAEKEKPERAERPDRRREAPRDDRRPEPTRDLPTSRPATVPSDVPTVRERGERTQGEQSAEILRDQRRIARGIGDRYEEARRTGTAEDAGANELAELQARLDAAHARHQARMEELRAVDREASDAGDRKQIQKARRALDAQEAAHDKEVLGLEKRIRELQGRGRAPIRSPYDDIGSVKPKTLPE